MALPPCRGELYFYFLRSAASSYVRATGLVIAGQLSRKKRLALNPRCCCCMSGARATTIRCRTAPKQGCPIEVLCVLIIIIISSFTQLAPLLFTLSHSYMAKSSLSLFLSLSLSLSLYAEQYCMYSVHTETGGVHEENAERHSKLFLSQIKRCD